VQLHSDTHRKPITSITAVLLPFVTYLLTLFHSWPIERVGEKGGVDYCVDLLKRNVRGEGKNVFDLCDFTLCAFFLGAQLLCALRNISDFSGIFADPGTCFCNTKLG
jgi:hypothetical protein